MTGTRVAAWTTALLPQGCGPNRWFIGDHDLVVNGIHFPDHSVA
jgi:hypothetical protein